MRTYSKEQLDAMIAGGLTGPEGPPGADGADGVDGADGAPGVPAYTTTSAGFTQPASGANVTVSVGDTSWMGPGQELYVATGGYYAVSSITNATTVVLTNSGYPGSASPGATINSGSKVSPGGIQGPAGGATNLDSLSDVAISSPSTGQVVKYNGTTWVNDTEAGGGTSVINAAAIPITDYQNLDGAVDAALTQAGDSFEADMPGAIEVSLNCNVVAAGDGTGELRAQYSINAGSSWNYLSSTGSGPAVSLTSTGFKDSGFVAIASGAKGTCLVRLVTINGAGVTVAQIDEAVVRVRSGLGTGGAESVNSVFGRIGTVVAASGDYNYSQISGAPAIASQAQADAGTDDATIMTPLKSANMLRVSPTEVPIAGTTTLTSSAFGKMHVCSGTTADYTVLIPTAVGNAGKVIGFRGPAISALNKIVTIDGSGTELVGGAQTLPFTHDWFILIESNGTNWVVLIDQWGRFGSVEAYKNATQAIGAATWTGVKFETENYDTDNWYDASLSRFTPKIPGRYRIGSSILVQSAAASQIYAVAIEQNASAAPARVLGRQFSVATGQFMSSPSNAVMVANGSTDFYQIILYNGGAVTLAAAPSESYFQAEFIGRS